MSDLTKKRMRYEILEEVEQFLLNRISSVEEEIAWKSEPREDGEPIPDWRMEEIKGHEAKIVEYREVIKVLPKLG